MTTIAFDGKTMAADTLATDSWGMRERTLGKIWANKYLLIGCAGNAGQIARWLMHLGIDTTIEDLVRDGYPSFIADGNDPTLLVVDRLSGAIYRHASGAFLRSHHQQFAVGSGRDFALAAMSLGQTAREAVQLAAQFDVNTGSEVIEFALDDVEHCADIQVSDWPAMPEKAQAYVGNEWNAGG